MARHTFEAPGLHIHLAVEGSTGGTTVGLHMAADCINDGKRVLWASVDMPDPARFSQLFAHLSLVESSRFHAMNFGGKFDRAMDALIEATNALPSVGLVVMDDWCETTGRIESHKIEHVQRFVEHCPEDVTVLLISKGSVDASGASEDPIVARAADAMTGANFTIWRLWRHQNTDKRVLASGDERVVLTLAESGFEV